MTRAPLPPRILLFCPGSRPDRFSRGLGSGAGAAVLDLEDSVAEAEKATARTHVQQALANLERAIPLWVRTNAVDTAHFADDIHMALDGAADGIILPSIDDPGAVEFALDTIATGPAPGGHHRRPWICITLETSSAFLRIQEIVVPARSGVDAIMFGSVDLSAELGLDADDRAHPVLAHARSSLVLAAAAAACVPMDGVLLRLGDETLMESDTLTSARTGFWGRAVVHPDQITPAARAYLTHDRRRAEPAHEIVARFEAALQRGVASIEVNGRMVDYPVYEEALAAVRAAERASPPR